MKATCEAGRAESPPGRYFFARVRSDPAPTVRGAVAVTVEPLSCLPRSGPRDRGAPRRAGAARPPGEDERLARLLSHTEQPGVCAG